MFSVTACSIGGLSYWNELMLSICLWNESGVLAFLSTVVIYEKVFIDLSYRLV